MRFVRQLLGCHLLAQRVRVRLLAPQERVLCVLELSLLLLKLLLVLGLLLLQFLGVLRLHRRLRPFALSSFLEQHSHPLLRQLQGLLGLVLELERLVARFVGLHLLFGHLLSILLGLFACRICLGKLFLEFGIRAVELSFFGTGCRGLGYLALHPLLQLPNLILLPFDHLAGLLPLAFVLLLGLVPRLVCSLGRRALLLERLVELGNLGLQPFAFLSQLGRSHLHLLNGTLASAVGAHEHLLRRHNILL